MKKYEKSENPVVLRSDMHISGVNYVDVHEYTNGHRVPVYLVDDYYALNKILGYAKYINGDYGTILYRGECVLHNTLIPSIHRGIASKRGYCNANYRLNNLMKRILNDDKFLKTIITNNQSYRELILEGLLQHYGIKTHFIDVVDNHWIALWFGLYEAVRLQSLNSYIHYVKRNADKDKNNEDLFQYIILIASNNNITNLSKLNAKSKTVAIDLRANLPSTFLRPHAQHGFVIRKLKCDEVDGYDMSKYVVGIIKISIKCVEELLGDGTLLTTNNLFPSPAYDLGYDLLLERTDLFNDSICRITY